MKFQPTEAFSNMIILTTNDNMRSLKQKGPQAIQLQMPSQLAKAL